MSESTKLLHQGKYNLAAPAALQALKTSVELFGNGNIDTTPAYFALAEANIGMNYHVNNESLTGLKFDKFYHLVGSYY